MSYANILGSDGRILPSYLPTEAIVTPTLDEVLTAGNGAGGQSITGLVTLNVDKIVPNLDDYVTVAKPLAVTSTGTFPVTDPPVGVVLYTEGNVICDGKLGVALSKFMEDDGNGNLLLVNQAAAPNGKLNFQGPAGIGEVYDSVNNPLPSSVTTKYIRVSGTNTVPDPGLTIPQSNNANPGKTIGTLNLAAIGNNTSFQGYLNLVTGRIENPDSATIAYQVYLSDTLDAAYDASKGLAILRTGVLNAGVIAAPGNTYNAIPVNLQTAATQTLYLNVQALDPGTGPVGGSTWLSTQYTLDLYAF